MRSGGGCDLKFIHRVGSSMPSEERLWLVDSRDLRWNKLATEESPADTLLEIAPGACQEKTSLVLEVALSRTGLFRKRSRSSGVPSPWKTLSTSPKLTYSVGTDSR